MTEEEMKKAQEAEAAAAAAEEAQQEGSQPAGGGEAEEKKPTSRDMVVERIRTSMPDGEEFQDGDDFLFDQISKRFAMGDEASSKWNEISAKLTALMDEDPEEAMAILDRIDKKVPNVATSLRKYKGDDALSMKEGDEGWDAYEQAGKERADRLKSQSDWVENLKKNAEKSEADFKAWAEKHGMSEEEAGTFWDFIYQSSKKMNDGIYDDDIFDKYHRAFNYEKDLAGAREQGLAEGRNAKIEAERKRMEGSGLPNGKSGNGASEEEVKETNNQKSTVEWMDRFTKRR